MTTHEDISTIISIVPVDIREFKPGIYPGQFNIDACKHVDKPTIYYVKGSKQMMQVSGQKQPIAIETPSFTIAEAIVRDYNASILARENGAAPGLAFIIGKISREEFIANHYGVLKELEKIQKVWYVNLVKMTDNDWARYHNHKAVSDIAKIACRALGLDREWLIDIYSAEGSGRCEACEQTISKTQVVCHHCRAIQSKHKEKATNVKFAV